MEMLAEEMGVGWQELHCIFTVRMEESECIAIKSFMVDYPAAALVEQLRAGIAAFEASNNASDQSLVTPYKATH